MSRALHIIQHKIQHLLFALPDPMFIFDQQGTCLYATGGSDRRLYAKVSEVEGQHIKQIYGQQLGELALTKINQVISSGDMRVFEYQLDKACCTSLTGSGVICHQWFQGRLSVINEPGEAPWVVWVAVNITERKRLEYRLRFLSEHDPLTGCHNRRTFLRETSQLIPQDFPACLILVDIDQFKTFNDTYGHDLGDEALRHFVEVAFNSIRPDDLLARTTGEEFAILLRRIEFPEAIEVATRLKRYLSKHQLKVLDQPLPMTVSQGVVELEDHRISMDDIMKLADDRLRLAKGKGRNCIVSDNADQEDADDTSQQQQI